MLEVGHLPLPLGVEAADELDVSVPAHRHTQGLDDLTHDRQRPLVEMGVLVRVDVGGRPAKEPVEVVELAQDFSADGMLGAYVERPLVLAPHVPVQTDRQTGVVARHRRRLRTLATGHHEAGAGDDAVLVGLDHTTVDTCGRPEVVGVEDHVPHQRSSAISPYRSM